LGATLTVTSLTTAASTSGAVALLEFMVSTKVKTLAVGLLGVALLVPIVSLQRAVAQLRVQNASLRNDAQQFDALRADNARSAAALAATPEADQFRIDQSELMRLRGEVTLLRNERAEWKRQNTASSATVPARPEKMELKGRLRTRDQWQDRGLSDPQRALETVWLALARKDEQRLKEATIGYYEPTNVIPRIVDSSVTMLLGIRATSVSGIQVLSSSEGADGDKPGSIHYVSFVVQKEYGKDRDGKPVTQQDVEKWAFQRTEQGEFKMVPTRTDVVTNSSAN
jgi:hypothetical protein